MYALDLLPDATPEFHELKARAPAGSLHFRAVDVRDEAKLHATVASIADDNGRLDGLIAAAGINEEYTALEYTAADFKKMMDINVCGAFLTAQATARQMVRLGKGGSIVMIGSMSARISNRVRHTLSRKVARGRAWGRNLRWCGAWTGVGYMLIEARCV